MNITNRNTDQRTVNTDPKNGIHYGVISQHQVLQAWADSSEANYGKPEEAVKCSCGEPYHPTKDDNWGDTITCRNCGEKFDLELPDCSEPLSFFIDDGEYSAECGEDGDIFILKSPYYTRCRLCSPCAPNAGYLLSPDPLGVKTYCFDKDWFEDEKAPYPIFPVKIRRKSHGSTS